MARMLALWLIALACLATHAQAQSALGINAIKFGEHPDKIRMVVELSGPTEFRTYATSDPYRIVIDLPEFDWRVGRMQNQPSSFATALRQGPLQAGFSRIVVDMNRPVVIRSAFTLPAEQGRPHRLVIDYAASNAAQFAAHKDKPFGRLNIQPAPQSAPTSTPAQVAEAPRTIMQLPIDRNGAIIPDRKPQMAEVAPSKAPAPIPAPTPAPIKGAKPLIVIDPGHGGIDPGAIGANGVFEKNITLAMARELKKQLESTGRYRVALTRDEDVYLKLFQRVSFARSKKADLFISLHADSINQSGVQGASIYTLSEKASDQQTARLAERENRADLIAGVDLTHEDEQVADILVDLTLRDTMNQSKFFANTIVREFGGQKIRTLENPHRYAGFAVLKAPEIPSVLVELGFMSNRKEAEQLSSPEHRRKIAGALVNGIDAYFSRVRS